MMVVKLSYFYPWNSETWPRQILANSIALLRLHKNWPITTCIRFILIITPLFSVIFLFDCLISDIIFLIYPFTRRYSRGCIVLFISCQFFYPHVSHPFRVDCSICFSSFPQILVNLLSQITWNAQTSLYSYIPQLFPIFSPSYHQFNIIYTIYISFYSFFWWYYFAHLISRVLNIFSPISRHQLHLVLFVFNFISTSIWCLFFANMFVFLAA